MNNEQLREKWSACLEIFKDNVDQHAFNVWFSNIEPLSYDRNELVVKVDSDFFVDYLETHYLDLICKTLQRVFGSSVKLIYSVIIDKNAGQGMVIPATQEAVIQEKAEEQQPQVIVKDIPQTPGKLDSRLMPQYSFSNFIQGKSNKLSRSIGESISNKPGTTFNPFFIYGPSGVGKTHLANAIGLKIKEQFPLMRVLYVSAHLFMVQYTDSVRYNKQNDFISFYQTIDVLIIDDIQELAGQTKTQNTFFHIFNQLHQNGKQLIMTSDRSPMLLQGISERLLTRFKWGMVAEIEKPDLELRKAILRSRIQRDGLTVPEDVVNFIAEHIEGPRDLEGILVSIMAHAIVNDKDIDLQMAEKVIGEFARIETKTITIDHIIKVVCEHYGIETEKIHDKSRRREIVQARQMAMYLAKQTTDYSAAKIGKLIGDRDHATVLHAVKTVKNQADVDKYFKSELEEIQAMLTR